MARDAAALAAFLPQVAVRDLPDETDSHYAEIRADLKRRGVLIGGNDLLIAARRGPDADATRTGRRRRRAT